ncbi:MAG TPA: DUF1295 domain-containing protein [bacterium]
MISPLAVSAQVVFIYMTLLFFLALLLKDNSIVDIGWGIGFIVVVWTLTFFHPESFAAKHLIQFFTTLWGTRLAAHIGMRNMGRGEDFRYAQWRKAWGRAFWWRSYLQVFMLQGLLMLVISLPAIVLFAGGPRPLGRWGGMGAFVFLFGFLFETVADFQLKRFVKDPANRGRLMTSGLWAWSRHPNYFGEAVLWWGLFLVSVDSSNGWLALLSPVTITVLVRWVSGVPLLEKKWAGRPDFEEYKKRVPVFLPFIPRRVPFHK